MTVLESDGFVVRGLRSPTIYKYKRASYANKQPPITSSDCSINYGCTDNNLLNILYVDDAPSLSTPGRFPLRIFEQLIIKERVNQFCSGE